MRARSLAVVALVLVLAACGGSGSDDAASVESAGAPDDRGLPTDASGSPDVPVGTVDEEGLPVEDGGGSDNPDVTSAPVVTEIPPPTTATPPPTTAPEPPPPPPPCRLEGDTLFATNRWDLRNTTPLERLAASIGRQADDPRIRIAGHTDSRGTAADNLVLSQRRADSVRTWFVQHGTPAGRISARGFGERQLRVRDTDAAGSFIATAGSQNRRVEIFVFSRHAIDC